MRPEKEAIVKEIREEIEGKPFLFLTDFTGMKVKHFAALRKELGEVDASLTVVKNSFLGVALDAERRELVAPFLEGKTAVVTGTGDVTAVAKALAAFQKSNKVLAVKGGCLNTRVLSEEDVQAMAKLPPRDVLLGQLVGTVQAPMTQLAGVMHAKVSSLLYVLTAIEEKKKEAA